MLGVARTVATTTRLLDALALLRGDRRVRVDFTTTSSAAFGAAGAELIDACGGRLLPWDDAVTRRFDLTVSTSPNGPLHRLRGPLLLLPHGAGQHKFLDPAAPARGVYGIAPEQLLDAGTIVPAALLLTGAEPLAMLTRDCPAAAGRARVAGDLTLQQLSAGLADRAHHRRLLGVRPGQRLVTVSSTWGPDSLLGRRPALPDRLLAGLPTDEYRVAAVLHPNIAARHSAYQIRSWFADALDSGLLLLPPDAWQSAVLAADLVLGDHGSVSFYAAALDLPVILTSDGGGDVPDGSAQRLLTEAAPRWCDDRDARGQIEAAVDGHVPGSLASITAASVDTSIDASAAYRATMYDLLGLDPPARTRVVPPPPAPVVERVNVTAHIVHATVIGPGAVALDRYPAPVRRPGDDGDATHLAVDLTEPDTRLRHSAAVVARSDRVPDAAAACRAILADHPGCRVAAAGDGRRVTIRVRDRAAVTAGVGDDRADPSALASAVYALGSRSPSPEPLRLLRIGGADIPVHTG